MCKLFQAVQNFIALVIVTEMANRTYNVFAAISEAGNGKLVYKNERAVRELGKAGKIPDLFEFQPEGDPN